VRWHGAAATAFLNRWDGGEGYQSIFLRRGYPVYIWDGPQVGRADWGCTEHTYKPGISRDQGNFTILQGCSASIFNRSKLVMMPTGSLPCVTTNR
jgi:hypothetical protein